MEKLKKLNGSMIAAIVLSVLLIMSLTAGATLAWFSSRDAGSRTLTMGEAVVVTISDQNADQTYRQGNGQLAMALPVDETTNGLLPGMSVTPNLKVQLQGSNTNALLRARFITTVEYPNGYMDAAYTDTTKYPNAKNYTAGSDGKVLPSTADEAAENSPYFPTANIYAGTMNYDYYDFQGRKVKYLEWDGTGTAPASPVAGVTVEGSDGKYALDKNGARINNGTYTASDATAHSVTIFLARVKVRDSIVAAIAETSGTINIAGMEVDKNTVTATNAAVMEIRQRGADLTDAINRVLSGERGYAIDPQTGELFNSDTVGVKYSRRVADGWAYRQEDKAWYYLGSSTNGFVLENQTGTNETVTTTNVASDITAYNATPNNAGTTTVYTPVYTKITDTDARNYLGTPDAATGVIEKEANEIAVMNQESMASVDLSGGNVSIDFLTNRFALPTFINNDYAKARITFSFTVEAVQDYLIDPNQEAFGNPQRVPNNLVNSILVFNNAFPATKVDGLAELEATGTFYNVDPGKSLTAANIPNKGYEEDASSHLADYTKPNATYEVGKASSLGVQTDGSGKVAADGTVTPQA